MGYQAGWQAGGPVHGLLGALVATAGIFLPSFLFILLGTPVLQRLRTRAKVRIFLAGLLAGVPGAVAGAAVSLSMVALKAGTPLIQLCLFVTAMWFSVSGRLKPLPMIGIALAIGILLEIIS